MSKKRILIWSSLLLITGVCLYNFYPEDPLPEVAVVDKIVVYKSKRALQVYNGENLLKTYQIALGGNPVGHKQYEGDSKTPEGVYYITDKNPSSGFHKNLGVSYPNEKDRAYARSIGKSPGGDIKIHGLRNYTPFLGKFHRLSDWTAGCMALTNQEIDELFRSVKVGSPIEIYP